MSAASLIGGASMHRDRGQRMSRPTPVVPPHVISTASPAVRGTRTLDQRRSAPSITSRRSRCLGSSPVPEQPVTTAALTTAVVRCGQMLHKLQSHTSWRSHSWTPRLQKAVSPERNAAKRAQTCHAPMHSVGLFRARLGGVRRLWTAQMSGTNGEAQPSLQADLLRVLVW